MNDNPRLHTDPSESHFFESAECPYVSMSGSAFRFIVSRDEKEYKLCFEVDGGTLFASASKRISRAVFTDYAPKDLADEFNELILAVDGMGRREKSDGVRVEICCSIREHMYLIISDRVLEWVTELHARGWPAHVYLDILPCELGEPAAAADGEVVVSDEAVVSDDGEAAVSDFAINFDKMMESFSLLGSGPAPENHTSPF